MKRLMRVWRVFLSYAILLLGRLPHGYLGLIDPQQFREDNAD
jgi:hypothetical protein